MNRRKLYEIHVFHPLSGHSRMPWDRDFGRIEKKRKKNKIIMPSLWVKLITNTDKVNLFKIIKVEDPPY